MSRAAIGLRKLFKLTDEDISLSPRSRMRVNLVTHLIENSALILYLVLHLNWAWFESIKFTLGLV